MLTDYLAFYALFAWDKEVGNTLAWAIEWLWIKAQWWVACLASGAIAAKLASEQRRWTVLACICVQIFCVNTLTFSTNTCFTEPGIYIALSACVFTFAVEAAWGCAQDALTDRILGVSRVAYAFTINRRLDSMKRSIANTAYILYLTVGTSWHSTQYTNVLIIFSVSILANTLALGCWSDVSEKWNIASIALVCSRACDAGCD